jgi:hypothetical protein
MDKSQKTRYTNDRILTYVKEVSNETISHGGFGRFGRFWYVCGDYGLCFTAAPAGSAASAPSSSAAPTPAASSA